MEEFPLKHQGTNEDSSNDMVRNRGVRGAEKNHRNQKPVTAQGVLLHFCEHTSMRGMKRAIHAPNILWRLTWMCAVLCGLGVGAFNVTQLIMHFFKYPRAIGEDIIIREVPFPAVTICNLQPISSATTHGQTVWTKKIDNYYSKLEEIIEKERARENNKGIGERNMSDSLRQLMSPLGYYQNANLTVIRETGHPRTILVPVCSWDTSDPHHEVMTPCINETNIVDPHFYNCYTYGTQNEMNIHPGHWGKLTIIGYLDDFLNTRMETHQEFHPDSTTANSQGARVVVHPPGTLSRPSLEGFNVSPGLSVSLNVKVTEYQRLGKPYSECTNEQVVNVSNTQGGFYVYTARSCADVCLQNAIYESCKCLDASLPRPRDLDRPNVLFCGLINGTTPPVEVAERLNCARSMYKQSESCNDRCVPPCHQYEYDVVSSQARWPHEASHISFYKAMIRGRSFKDKFSEYEKVIPMLDGNESEAYEKLKKLDLIMRNFLQINIYLDNSALKRIEETEVFEPINLMANVGGMLNLWIGITFITIFEFAECLYMLFSIGGRRQTNDDHSTSPQNGGFRQEMFVEVAGKQVPDHSKATHV